MKHIKLYEDYKKPFYNAKELGPSTEKDKNDRQGIEFNNNRNSMTEWLKLHPLTDVKFRDEIAVPKEIRWYQNDDLTWGYSVSFNKGEEYIAADGKGNNITRFNVRVGYQGVEGKEELLSWLNSSMIFKGVPPIIREKILKEVSEEEYINMKQHHN